MEGLLIVLAIAFFVAGPILGIIAFFRTQSLKHEIDYLRLRATLRSQPHTEPQPEPEPRREREPVPPAYIEERARVALAQSIEPDSVPAPSQPPSIDVEAIIGGKWLNAIGLAAMLLATAFFLKFAFDNNWIGPIGRVALGLLGGTGLIAGSQVILRRGWTYFSEGITALGAGVLYLSLYAAWNYYALVPTEVAFVGMAAVTASLIVLALARNTQRLAMLAMLGGYVTPLLVSTGHDAQIQLFSYLALLNAGLLWMALARDWRSLPLSFLFTLVYGLTWYTHFYDPAKLIPSLTFASVFFVEFALLPAIQARRNGALRADAIALTLLNAGWYLAALDVMLYSSHRWGLTAGVLAVAAFYLILANITAPRSDLSQPAARPIFGSVALTCATVSIPIRLEGQWIVMAWALESLILVWNGIQSGTAWLRGAGLIVLFAVTLYLLEIVIPSPQPFLNGRFATYVIVAAALGLAGWLARRNDHALGEGERLAFKCAEVVSNLIALIGLSAETMQLLGPVSPIAVDTSEAEQLLGLSLVWALYACALAAIGLIGDLARVRYQAYVLFTVVLVKAMFLDSQYTISESPHPFVNLRFLTSAVIFAALAFSLVLSQRRVSSLPAVELSVHRAFQVALNVFAVWALTIEVWHAFPVNAQEFAVSLVWTAYAGILIVIGIRRESALVRWQALVLFGCVILKAVFVDLAMLALGYRVASFFALGVILVGASFLYQRRLFGQGTNKR